MAYEAYILNSLNIPLKALHLSVDLRVYQGKSSGSIRNPEFGISVQMPNYVKCRINWQIQHNSFAFCRGIRNL